MAMALSASCLGGFLAPARAHPPSRRSRPDHARVLRAVERGPGERAKEGQSVTGPSTGKNNAVSRTSSDAAASSPSPSPSPSLADYDEDQYGDDSEGRDRIHSDAVVPRLERFINSAIVSSAVFVIDALYEGREYPRFYALETVARVPYFSFVSVLHLYETLGFWRRADYLKVHFAQTMNEFHHLLIMEAMGGDEKFADRFFAQHMAVAYYGMTCLIYLASPRMAYNLSEQVEAHAYHTYDEFLTNNEEALRNQPPPAVAVKYYAEGDLFLFDEFQTGDPYAARSACAERRRPVIKTLYDVFENVRDDEAEHMKTMQFCQLPGSILRAPSERAENCLAEEASAETSASGDGDPSRSCEGLMDCVIRAQDEPNWQKEKETSLRSDDEERE